MRKHRVWRVTAGVVLALFAGEITGAGGALAQGLPNSAGFSTARSGGALAQGAATPAGTAGSESCVCALPLNRFPVAHLNDIIGDVRIGTEDGFTPVGTNAPLALGDRIIFQDSNAVLSSGPECQIAVGPQAVVNITRLNNQACVTIDNFTAARAQTPTDPATPPQPDADTAAQVALGALLLGGGAAAIVGLAGGGGSDGGGRPVSPE